jgi:hypothetical protein
MPPYTMTPVEALRVTVCATQKVRFTGHGTDGVCSIWTHTREPKLNCQSSLDA